MNLVYNIIRKRFPIPQQLILKVFEYLLKVAIFVFLCWAIYKQVFVRNDLNELFVGMIQKLHPSFFFILLTVAIMMVINWGLEAKKWQLLVKNIEKVSFLKSWKAVLSGVTIGMFTPNRIGEFGGKLLYIIPENRVDALAVSFIGSLAQIACTIIFGCVSLLFLHETIQAKSVVSWGYLSLILLVIIALTLLFYFYLPKVGELIGRLPILNKIKMYSRVISKYNSLNFNNILLLSVIRYAVYSIQFALLLKIFGIDIAFSLLMVSVAMIFLAQTILPSIAILDIGIRGNIAIFILQPYTEQLLGILTASLFLWVINLVIPSIIGYFYISKQKLLR